MQTTLKQSEVSVESPTAIDYINFNKPCSDRDLDHIERFKQRLRECTNPDCLWVGTREQAIRGIVRNQRDTPYYSCPECRAKIQNDGERADSKLLEHLPLDERILVYLFKKPGSTLGNIRRAISKRDFSRQEMLWKLSEMLGEEKIYRVGTEMGRGTAKYFIDSKYLFRNSIKHELGGKDGRL